MPLPTLDEYLKRKTIQKKEDQNRDPEFPSLVDAAETGSPDTNPYLAEAMQLGLTGDGGDPAPTAHGPLYNAWHTATKPLRIINSLGSNVGGQLAGLVDPVGYESAHEERIAGTTEGENRDLTLGEKAESLPGLGGVLTSHLSKEGWVGRLRPALSLVGDIAGDPLTYAGGWGLLTKGGRAAGALAEAQRAVQAAEAVGDVAKASEIAAEIPTLASAVAKIYGEENALSRGVRTGLQAADSTLHGGLSDAAAELMTRPSFRAATRVALRAPISPLAGVAYAPDIAEGIAGGVEQTAEDVRAGRLKEAAASGVGTLMTSALGLLAAKGLIDEGTAAKALARNLGKTLPAGVGDAPPVKTQSTTTREPGAPARLEDQITVAPEPEVQPQLAAVAPAAPVAAPVVTPEVLAAPPVALEVTPQVVAPVGEVAPAPVEVATPVAKPVAPTPAPEQAQAPVRPPVISPEKYQGLNDLLDEYQKSGAVLTKAILRDRLGVPEHVTKNTSWANLVGSEHEGRLVKAKGAPGGGVLVKELPQVKSEAATTSPAPPPVVEPTTHKAHEVVPADNGTETAPNLPINNDATAAPKSTAQPGARLPIKEDPERLQAAHDVIDRVAADLGHFPSDQEVHAHPLVQSLEKSDRQDVYLTRWDREQGAKVKANQELVKRNPAPFNQVGEGEREIPVTPAVEAQKDLPLPPTPTATAPERIPGGASPAPEPAPAVEGKPSTVRPADFEKNPDRYHVIERGGETYYVERDVAQKGRGQIKNPAPARGGETRPALPEDNVERPGIGLPDLEPRTRAQAAQATTPTVDVEGALQSQVRQGIARSGAPRPAPEATLDTPEVERARQRLVGTGTGANFDRDSPAGRIQAELRQNVGSRHRGVQLHAGALEDALQTTTQTWLQDVRDPERHLRLAADEAAAHLAEGGLGAHQTAKRLLDEGQASYEQALNHKRLLHDAADSPEIRAEIGKLLRTESKNRASNEIWTEKRRGENLERHKPAETRVGGKVVEQHPDVKIPDAFSKLGDSAIETPHIDLEHKILSEPAALNKREFELIATDPKIEQRARENLAWDFQQALEHGTGKSSGKESSPHMDRLRQMARDLGIGGKETTLDKKTLIRLGNDILHELDKRTGKETQGHVVAELLTDAEVAKKGLEWSRKIQKAAIDPATGVRTLSLTGEGDRVVPLMTGISRSVSDTLTRSISDLAAAAELPTRFAGHIVDPQLNGIRMGDDTYLNIAESYRQEKAKNPNATPAELAQSTARRTIDNAMHEIVHRKARHDAATGDQAFIEAYHQALSDVSPLYQQHVDNLARALEPHMQDMESRIAPAYNQAREDALGNLARNHAGSGQRRITPIPNRPGGGPGGASGRVQPGLQRGGDVSEGSGGTGGRGREGAESRERVPAGAQGQAGAGGGAGGRGRVGVGSERGPGAERVGVAEITPHANIATDYARRYKEDLAQGTINRVQDHFAVSLANTLNLPKEGQDALLKRYAEIQKMTPEERAAHLKAGPGEKLDLRLRLEKYADVLSEDQRIAIAHQQLILESLPGAWQKIPMTAARADAEALKLFGAHTPEELIKKLHQSGIRTVPEFVATRTALATMGEAVDDARIAEGLAHDAHDLKGVEEAQRQHFFAAISRDLAISALTRDSRAAAQKLVMLKTMAHALDPNEAIKSRFMGAMRVSKLPEAQVKGLWSMVEDILEQEKKTGAPGTGDWYRFHEAFRDATRAGNFDKFLEFWKAGLFGFPTHVANTVSNAAFFGLRTIESGVASIANQAIAGVIGAPRDRYVGEIAARNRGLRHAVGDAFSILKSDIVEALTLQEPNIARKISEGSFHDEPNFRQLYGAIEGKKGEFVRIPFKLLDAADGFFKHILRTQEYSVQAHRLAQDAGTRKTMGGASVASASDQIFRELQALSSDPMKNVHLAQKLGYMDALKAGRKVAIDDTFQTPLTGVMKSVDQVFADHPSLQLLAPFRKTPYNILAEGMRRTPLGAIKTLKDYAAGKIDRPEMVLNMTKSAIGTAIMGVVAGAALEGSVTGSGPSDPKQTELLKKTGWQPFSIRIPGAPGQPADYISYKRLEPFSTMIGLAVDTAEAWRSSDHATANELMDKAIMSASDNILDKSFLTGLESLVKILTNAGGSRASAVKQLQASLIPNVVGVIPVGSAASALDPNYRETEAGTLSPFTAKIPGLSTTLQPQYSPTGQIRERPGTPAERLLSPFTRTTEKTDPVAVAARELSRLGKAPDSPPLYLKVGDEKVYYSPDERQALAQAQERGMAKIAEIISRPGYDRLPDEDTVELGTKRKTKGDVVHEVLEKYVGPLRQRINRQALRRAQQEVRS